MKGQKISEIAKNILQTDPKFNFRDSVAYGDLDLLHEIFEKSDINIKVNHPMNKTNAVLNALDRESKRADSIFTKHYFQSYKGLARIFYLKKKKD